MVVLVAFGVFFVVNRDSEDELPTEDSTTTSETNETSMPADDNEPQAKEETKLSAVGDYTGSGTATRTTEGTFLHEVVAELGPPADGDFYEGWLLGPSIVSAAMLIDEGGGMWSLTFTSDEDLSEHNSVVITEETLSDGLDGIPEDHVLEGDF